MAIHTSTTPAQAGERSRLPKRQAGPVTLAIHAMRADETADQRAAIRRLADSIRERVAIDLDLIASLERAAARLTAGGAA